MNRWYASFTECIHTVKMAGGLWAERIDVSSNMGLQFLYVYVWLSPWFPVTAYVPNRRSPSSTGLHHIFLLRTPYPLHPPNNNHDIHPQRSNMPIQQNRIRGLSLLDRAAPAITATTDLRSSSGSLSSMLARESRTHADRFPLTCTCTRQASQFSHAFGNFDQMR